MPLFPSRRDEIRSEIKSLNNYELKHTSSLDQTEHSSEVTQQSNLSKISTLQFSNYNDPFDSRELNHRYIYLSSYFPIHETFHETSIRSYQPTMQYYKYICMPTSDSRNLVALKYVIETQARYTRSEIIERSRRVVQG